MPPSSCKASTPRSPRYSAAFSQRMPPVQKLTTVLPSSSARRAAAASGNCVKRSMRQSSAPVERAVVDLERVAGVEQHHLAAGVVVSLIEPATQRLRRDRGRPVGGRADRRVVHPDDLALDLDEHPAEGLLGRPALLRRERRRIAGLRAARRRSRAAACGSPARNRLMPSSASRIVPLSPARSRAAEESGRSCAGSSIAVKR